MLLALLSIMVFAAMSLTLSIVCALLADTYNLEGTMKLLYVLNAMLWLVDGLVWAAYTRMPFMAAVSFTACGVCIFFARKMDEWVL